MFRPVVAIIRSLSFDTLKIILYNCVVIVDILDLYLQAQLSDSPTHLI